MRLSILTKPAIKPKLRRVHGLYSLHSLFSLYSSRSLHQSNRSQGNLRSDSCSDSSLDSGLSSRLDSSLGGLKNASASLDSLSAGRGVTNASLGDTSAGLAGTHTSFIGSSAGLAGTHTSFSGSSASVDSSSSSGSLGRLGGVGVLAGLKSLRLGVLALLISLCCMLPSSWAETADNLDQAVVNTLPREIQDGINNFAQANGQPRLPTIAEVNTQIASLANDISLDDTEKERIKSILQNELNLLQDYANSKQERLELNESLANSQANLQALSAELDSVTKEFGGKPDESDLKDKNLDELNTLVAQVNQQLDKSQAAFTDASSEYNSLQSLPTRVQNTVSANNERIYTIVKQLNDRSGNMTSYEKEALCLEAYVLSYESTLLEQRSHAVTYFQDQSHYKMRINETKKNYYTQYLNDLRALQTKLVNEQSASVSAQGTDEDYSQISQLQSEIQINSQYAAEIHQATLDNTQLTTEVNNVDNALNSVYQIEKVMQDQISDISESLLLSRLLNRQQGEIPSVSISFNLDEMLTNLTISLFDLRVQREYLFDIDNAVNKVIELNPKLANYQEPLRQIMLHRKSLLEQLYQLRSESLSLSVSLRDKYQEFSKTADNVNTIINDHLFWLASNSGISIDFFSNFIPEVTKQFQNFGIKFNNPDKLKERLMHWLSVFLPILLIGFVMHKFRPLVQRRLNKLALRLDKPNDTYWLTPLSLIYHFFCIIPLLALLTDLGSIVIFLILDNFSHQTEITCLLALHLACFLYVRNILETNSLAQRHFCFSIENNTNSRQIIDKIWFISTPMLLIANMRILEPTLIASDLIGYTLMFLGFLYLTVFAFRTSKKRFETFTPTVGFWTIAVVGCLTPLTLTIMLALGYYYTVIQLLNRVAITLYIFFLYFITSNTLRRELYVAENQMLMAARAKLLAQNNESVDQDKSPDANTKRRNAAQSAAQGSVNSKRGIQVQALRLDLVNTRSFKLFNGFILCVFLYFMYLQWNDLAGVLNYLNQVYLWTKISIVDGKEVITNYLSLGHLLLAIIIVIVTTILAKNLPNLLERLFLLRSNSNNKSTSYTVKIISFYAIATIGIIMAAGVMGISWDNLQWLVAALSVGLGFGLQEIFGNFVSGIILLFERQLRVGDIVTLNSLSGTVSKIRIRATTIIAFDNKEVVIPNKQFITSALTNWSLSNTITKLEFEVGIAYDADINKAKDLLRGIMRRCKNLNRDKKPVVYVKNLNASAITLLCEVYVNEIGKRKETFDYLSTETLRLFGEHNIEIPFDRLDVTVLNLDNGQRLTETQTNTVAAQSAAQGSTQSSGATGQVAASPTPALGNANGNNPGTNNVKPDNKSESSKKARAANAVFIKQAATNYDA